MPALVLILLAIACVASWLTAASGKGARGAAWAVCLAAAAACLPGAAADMRIDCPLPVWDVKAMASLTRTYHVNDTDVASLPWVNVSTFCSAGANSDFFSSSGVLNVPKVKCEQRAEGHLRRRVVVVLVDAIHRPLFEAKYPHTIKFGRRHHDVFEFKHQHTHGFNSGPNKRALFAGFSNTGANSGTWLHETFKRSGYTTIHADDVCNPDAVPGCLTALMAAKPADVMPHDQALCNTAKSCTDPDPSCTAPSSLEFVAQAVEQHAHCDLFVTVNPNQEHSIRWWYSKADLWVSSFLKRVVDQYTIAVVISDHGLHYGPQATTTIGAAYRTNPFLSILWPKRMRGAESKALQRSTGASLTTHLNVHSFLDAIANGKAHDAASLASPAFPLNQTCKEARIPTTECRCILTRVCTPATSAKAKVLLAATLRNVSANPYCKALQASEFSIDSCTGSETAHFASFARHSRRYKLSWDEEAEAVSLKLQQLTKWAKDVDPCRSVVPEVLWPLCICSSAGVRAADASTMVGIGAKGMLAVGTGVKGVLSPAPPPPPSGQNRRSAMLAFLLVVGAAVLLLCIGRQLVMSGGWPERGPLAEMINGSLKAVPLLAMGVSVLATCMATLQSIVVQISKVHGRVEYHMSSAVFYTEFLKLLVSIALWVAMPATRTRRPLSSADGRLGSSNDAPSPAAFSKVTGVLAYAVPAALYLAQNNLTIRAMGLLDPPTFQLWVSFRLLPAAVLTRFVLKRHVSLVQWIALILLVLGMSITTLKEGPSAHGRRVYVSTTSADNKSRGIVLVLINGFLSAASGVINEWLLKYPPPLLATTSTTTSSCSLRLPSRPPPTPAGTRTRPSP